MPSDFDFGFDAGLVDCGGTVECGVWSVECGVWCVVCGVFDCGAKSVKGNTGKSQVSTVLYLYLGWISVCIRI